MPRSIRSLISALEDSLGQLEEADSEVIDAGDLDLAVKRLEEIAAQATKDSEPEEDDEDEDEDEDGEED
jgi:uncharacterized alpha-E superfamily protein